MSNPQSTDPTSNQHSNTASSVTGSLDSGTGYPQHYRLPLPDDIAGATRPSRSGAGTPEHIPDRELHLKNQRYLPPDDITGVMRSGTSTPERISDRELRQKGHHYGAPDDITGIDARHFGATSRPGDLLGATRPSRSGAGTPEHIPDRELHLKGQHYPAPDDITGVQQYRSGASTPERISDRELKAQKGRHYPPPDDITGVQVPSGEGGTFVRLTDSVAHAFSRSSSGKHDTHAHGQHSHLRDGEIAPDRVGQDYNVGANTTDKPHEAKPKLTDKIAKVFHGSSK